MRKSFLAVVFLAFSSLLAAQQTLNNDAVIKLVKAGLSEDLIVATINAQPGTYDTSTNGLISLKNGGVSDKVVAAIVMKASAPATAAPAEANPDDPNSPHDPGVYLYTVDRDGKQKMTFIDQVGVGREKTHGRSTKAELPGARAAVRTADSKPVFYMYFSPNANISEVGTISSPSQFSLVALDKKPDHRETVIAHVGWAHVDYGNDAKKTSLFESQRIRPYTYKVSLNEGMKTGEYAFIATTSMAGTAHGATVVMYDFGLDTR